MSFLAAAFFFAVGATAPVTRVTDSYPTLSPDGRTLVFQSNRSGRSALYAADSDGSNARVIYDKHQSESPSWSHNGARIAFVALVDGQAEIFVMSADGAEVRRLTDHPGDDSHPHWSSDGRIFFNSARTTPDLSAEWSKQYHEIFSMTADGSDLKQHTNCRSVCTFPSPSPDGKYLAYRKVVGGGGRSWDQSEGERNSEVFVARLDGKDESNLSNDKAFDGWPVWTPDSNYVVFASNRGGTPNVGQIFAVRRQGGEIFKLTNDQWSNVQPFVPKSSDAVFTCRSMEDETGEFGHIAKTPINLP